MVGWFAQGHLVGRRFTCGQHRPIGADIDRWQAFRRVIVDDAGSHLFGIRGNIRPAGTRNTKSKRAAFDFMVVFHRERHSHFCFACRNAHGLVVHDVFRRRSIEVGCRFKSDCHIFVGRFVQLQDVVALSAFVDGIRTNQANRRFSCRLHHGIVGDGEVLFMPLVVLIADTHPEFLSGIGHTRRIVVARRSGDVLAGTGVEPLVLHAIIRHTISIVYRCRQRFVHFVTTADGNLSRLVRLHVIRHAVRFAAGRCFIVLCVVAIGRTHADFVSGVFRLQRVAVAGRTTNRRAVAQPLILHRLRHAVGIRHCSGEVAANLRFATNGNTTRLIRHHSVDITDSLDIVTEIIAGRIAAPCLHFAPVFHHLRRQRHRAACGINLHAFRQILAFPLIVVELIFVNGELMCLLLLVGVGNFQRIRVCTGFDDHAALMSTILRNFRQSDSREIVVCSHFHRITMTTLAVFTDAVISPNRSTVFNRIRRNDYLAGLRI